MRNLPIINIVCRVKEPEKYFDDHYKSIKMQTHRNIRYWVLFDDKKHIPFLKRYDRLRRVYIDYKKPYKAPILNEKEKIESYWYNDVFKKIDKGWVIFLDEDCVLSNPNCLETMLKNVKNGNDLCIFQSKKKSGIIKPKLKDIHNRGGEVGINNIMVNYDLIKKHWFDKYENSEKRFIEYCFKLSGQKKWVGHILLNKGLFLKGDDVRVFKDLLFNFRNYEYGFSVFNIKNKTFFLDNNGVIATMATFSDRENVICDSIKSIINQVDEIWVYVNSYRKLPKCLNHEKIKVFLAEEHVGDIKAKGKFYNCENISGYHFTIDDDIIYPPDYVKKYITLMKKHDNKICVSSLGKIINKNPRGYYKNYGKSILFRDNRNAEMQMHVPGTGVMCYHTDHFKVNFDEIKNGSYVDLFLGLQLQKNKIPVYTPKHKAGWIVGNNKLNVMNTLYSRNFGREGNQFKLLKSITWRFFK